MVVFILVYIVSFEPYGVAEVRISVTAPCFSGRLDWNRGILPGAPMTVPPFIGGFFMG
jgi:hypothetical protein